VIIKTAPAGQLMTPHWSPQVNNTSSREPIDLSITDISIDGGVLDLEAGHIRQDFALNINHLAFTQDAFTADDVDGAFTLTVGTRLNETASLTGQYNHHQGRINGQLELNNWQSVTLLGLLPADWQLSSTTGSVSAQGQLDWSFSQRPLLNFERISWQDWQLSQPGMFTADQFNSEWQQVRIDAEQSVVAIELIGSAQANWQLFSSASASQQTPTPHNEPATDATQPAWQLTAERVTISDWQWQWHEAVPGAMLSGRINQLQLSGVNNQGQTINAKSRWQLMDGGEISTEDQLTLDPVHINSQLTIRQLNLTTLRPWISEASGLLVNSGQLNADQRLSGNLSAFSLHGRFDITQLNLMHPEGHALAAWQNLRVEASSVDSQRKTIVLDQISLDQASGNLPPESGQTLISGQSDTQMGDAEAQPWVVQVGELKVTPANQQTPD
jgi:hypothetical protein